MSNSGSSTPRFAAPGPSAEEVLKDQTVGLVQLDDFRKRRRDVEDLRNNGSGTVTPKTEGSDADTDAGFKKKKRKAGSRKLLSFDDDEDPDNMRESKTTVGTTSALQTQAFDDTTKIALNRKSKSNPNAAVPAPKAMTKASLAAEAAERDRLRSEYVKTQEQVRDTPIAIPFVFYDGSSLPGGTVRVKKGEHIWLLLERCRKLGAEIGVSGEGSIEGGGSKQRVEGKKSWARIGVDDLMLIRGDIIVPHHYEFYYFIINKIADPNQSDKLLFDYSTSATTKDLSEPLLLTRPKDEQIEGHNDDASYTKVVDRRWYEKNKHIYPASLWREYKVGKEYEELLKGRRDAQGNSFFFA